MNSFKIEILAVVVLMALWLCCAEAKFLRRSPYYDDLDGMYGAGSRNVPTGERAILTVRGARNPYDGSAPGRLTIEDNPWRGPYPRGIYDRLDGYGGGRYPRRDPYDRYDRYDRPYGYG